MCAFWSFGLRISAISSPCPGPTATATCPPLDMRRSASSGARASIAPGQMSIARGVPTMRVSSGTVPPGAGRRARASRAAVHLRLKARASRGVLHLRVKARKTRKVQRSRPGGWLASSASNRDLARSLQVGVVVDLDPLDVTDRRRSHAAAAVGELLEAVLVVELGVAPPGGLERVGERRGGLGLDQRQADVLALRGRRVERLVDPVEQPVGGQVDLHLLLAERL